MRSSVVLYNWVPDELALWHGGMRFVKPYLPIVDLAVLPMGRQTDRRTEQRSLRGKGDEDEKEKRRTEKGGARVQKVNPSSR